MNKRLIQIDASDSKNITEDDLIKIKFSDEDTFQVNFPKFFFQSKYLRDKYKYSEAYDSIQDEIDEINNKMSISDESIKYFIQLVEEEKVKIPIELYRDIYTLSEYFCIQKFTTVLKKISCESLFNDLDFTIQILVDSEKNNKSLETKLRTDIENFLKGRINDCIENNKFKELSIPTICRIVEQSQQTIDRNLLVDFIFESAETRFILFKFVELHRLRDDKVDELIEFVDTQEETAKKMYLEYLPFNLSFIKNMKNKYDQLLSEFNKTKQNFNQIKQELNQEKISHSQTKKELSQEKNSNSQIKQELNQEKISHLQTKEELNQCKKELTQFKVELDRSENEMKRYSQSIIVCGNNKSNQLGGKSNNKNRGGYPAIHPPVLLSFDSSSLLSYAVYCQHAVLVTSDGSLKGVGDNSDGRISSTLQKIAIDHFTDFCIKDDSGRQLTAISAVCCVFGTLYMFSKSRDNERQLVLCDKDINGGDPVFLDIGNHQPVSLFGGFYSAAIGSEGEVIFINRKSVIKSPNSSIASVFLPDGEIASSVACCNDSVVVLSSSGRVFTSPFDSSGVLKFSIVSELSGHEIVCVSGKCEQCLAVSKEGLVFGRGSNKYGQLGFGKETKSVSSFTKIPSLEGYEIRAAYAGGFHSLFETREGKILSCGCNYSGQLLLSSGPGDDVYSPTETTIISGATFCIAGENISIVFVGSPPPPNTPNMRICQHK